LYDAGKVNAYIRLRLNPAKLVEVEDDDFGRNIFLYPDQDLVIEPYMNAELGIVE